VAGKRSGHLSPSRRITANVVQSDTGASSGTQTFHELGNNPLEERDLSGTVKDQYVWSGAGAPRLVLRDADADGNASSGRSGLASSNLEQRLYTLADSQNSTTGLLNFIPSANNGAGAWQVVERYVYGPDGRPYAFKADGTSYPSGQDLSGNPAPLDSTESRYSWEFLYRGQRYHPMYYAGERVVVGSIGQTLIFVNVGGGLYEAGSGGQWYDPQHARLLQPVGVPATGNNPYAADTGSWWGNAVQAFVSPGSFGAAGQVSMNGAFWSTLGVTRGVLTATAAVVVGVAVEPIGWAILAGAIGYGVYDVGSRLADGESGPLASWHTVGDLSGVEAIHQSMTNPELDSYQAGQLFGSGLVQFGASSVLAAQLGTSALRLTGYEWAIGPDADGSVTLGMGRVLRRVEAANEIVDHGPSASFVGLGASRDMIQGQGAYVLRDPATGQVFKVGSARDFDVRFQEYRAIEAQIGGDLAVDLYHHNLNGSFAVETALRSMYESTQGTLFWDGTRPRANNMGFALREFNLGRLTREDPNFGRWGWSVPVNLR